MGTVKHTHRDFDVPSKDSARHRDAGASRVVLSAKSGRAVLIPVPESTLEEIVASDLADMDIVLAEGFRSGGPTIPKLFVGDPADVAVPENVVGFLRIASAPIPDGEADEIAERLLEL